MVLCIIVGLSGVFLAFYFYQRRYKRNYLWILDRIAIASAPLFAFIRFGNLINSEIIGSSTNLPWAFIFIRVDTISRHPAQLYEALAYLFAGLLIFFVFWRSKKFVLPSGFVFGLGATSMASLRLLIEFLKENQVDFESRMILNPNYALEHNLPKGQTKALLCLGYLDKNS